MTFKRPESVLVVIHCPNTERVLMLQRKDDPQFWQSVTGSLEGDESPQQTALREIQEEVAIDIQSEHLTLTDLHHTVEFELFEHVRHRYAPDVTRNKEHWFCLALPSERAVVLSEHHAYQWLNVHEAAKLTKSWSNQQAIEQCCIASM
ncbi:dihydroneopterin triphosphate diphosphatase [Plesiomonas sp.]|uniref:dihydroneopterin triphosphate diphosphatase n=1 Tax=Plesiomonas sp. TaxID=2486279 RepID=UPI003F2F7ADB